MEKISVRLNKNGSISIRGYSFRVDVRGVVKNTRTITLREGSPAYLLVLNIAMSKFGCEWFGNHKWHHIKKPRSVCHFSHQGYFLLEAVWKLITEK